MEKTDLTFSGELKGTHNVIEEKTFDVLYTIDGETGKVTTTSILLYSETMKMITFNYQDLKEIVGDICEQR